VFFNWVNGKCRITKIIAVAAFVCIISSSAFSASFKPGQIWRDTAGIAINAHGGGILYHQGSYYWYGQHMIEGELGNKAMVGVHCYASKNLSDWKDEGIVLPVSDDTKSDIVEGCILERPKVIYNELTKKFVMWFHLELKDTEYNSARSGVAISDNPTGPFKYMYSCRPNSGVWPLNASTEQKRVPDPSEASKARSSIWRLWVMLQNILGRDFQSGQQARDMTLFVDDDGKAYHIYSSEENSTIHIALLSDDYLSHAGPYARAFPNRWMEAAAIFKHKGKYYFLASGCSGWAPNQARAGVAENIFGPWLEIDCPCLGVNPQNGMGPEKTYGAQSTYIFKVEGQKHAYIAMFDIWKPKNAIDGRYVWLPISINSKRPYFSIEWRDEWELKWFDEPAN